MLAETVTELSHCLDAIVRGLVGEAAPSVQLDPPKQASHGDLATSIALQAAKGARRAPRELAQAIVGAIATDSRARQLIESAEVAGPGFINLVVKAELKRSVIKTILRERDQFGRLARGAGQALMVEFVSANPTGPLHVGHARQAALGDGLANLFAANGYNVHREFYYNDAGAQIQNLALSVQARARGIGVDDPRFPADGYRGDYVADIAADFLARKTISSADIAPVTASGDANDLDAVRKFAVAYLRHEQDLDLKAFGVRFDRYYLESSLYSDGLVAASVERLREQGVTFEQDGALWFRSTAYGDDKDRVMRKSDGSYTYFVPDIAYHRTKWQRGFTKVIDVQGADHHGTIARVRAGLQALALGIPAGYPDYLLHKMVRVMRGGEEVKMSKRSGTQVDLRDLIEWSGAGDPQRGRDAVRFFLMSRKADTEYSFDIDLARSRSDENPVYYVQYAHARICSVFAQADPADTTDAQLEQAALSRLDAPREFALMGKLAQWPALVKDAADQLAPHSIAFYLKDLAAEVHSYYNAERILVDEPVTRRDRLALLAAARQVLRNGLALIGVSAPQRM